MKLIHRIILVPAIVFAVIPGMAYRASAQSAINQGLQSCNNISDPLRRSNCQLAIQSGQAQMALIRSWTPRQRYLDGRISHLMYDYSTRLGQPLPINRETVITMMRLIGANQREAGFVINRMQANYNMTVGINQTDRTIVRMNRFLQCLQMRGTGCIP